jgi:gluconate 2-dehydrogenase subunit 3-like protein
MSHRSFEQADHLPKRRASGLPSDPAGLPRQRAGTTPQMHGRYPDYDVLASARHWDETTRQAILDRVEHPPPLRFFDADEARDLGAFLDVVLAQDAEPRIPVLAMVDAKLDAGKLDGFRYAHMPDDRETWRLVARALAGFAALGTRERYDVVAGFADGTLAGLDIDAKSAWSVVMRGALSAFYSHPWAWNEIGFGGPAYPRGYMRLQPGPAGRDPHEALEAFDVDPVPDVDARGEG